MLWRPGSPTASSPTGKSQLLSVLPEQCSYSPNSYSRVETLSGFANGLFLCLISIFIVFEAIQRLLDPPEMNTGQLLVVSSLGLAVNLVGMVATGHNHHGHSHGGGGGHSDHSHVSSSRAGGLEAVAQSSPPALQSAPKPKATSHDHSVCLGGLLYSQMNSKLTPRSRAYSTMLMTTRMEDTLMPRRKRRTSTKSTTAPLTLTVTT